MKILLIQPSNAIAGAELSALQIMQGLSQRYGVFCHVALPPPDDSPYISMLKKTCSGIIMMPLMTWHRFKVASWNQHLISVLYRIFKSRLLYSVRTLVQYVRTNEIDLIYSNSGLCPIGGIVSRLTKRPHVWHIREKMGTGSEFPFYLSDNFSRKLFKQWSDYIVCNSSFTAGFFKDEIKDIKIVLNGIETESFSSADAVARGRELRRQLGIHDESLTIGMIGSIFSSWKEHDNFLRAARILKDKQVRASYVIFGGSREPGNSEYARTVFEAVSHLGLEREVIFPELQTDIPAMVNSMDIMMHPTSQESSCRVVMEAMAAGKPVVGVHAGGVSELIKNGENGVSVPAREPTRLAEAVLDVVRNESLRAQIGENALYYARQHFELTRTQDEIYGIFEHATNGGLL